MVARREIALHSKLRFSLNDHYPAENRTGRAQRGPFLRLARPHLADPTMLKTPSLKAIAR
jgi:hypothetical protein